MKIVLFIFLIYTMQIKIISSIINKNNYNSQKIRKISKKL